MTKITFIQFNGIKEYARVMYNDVKDADKYRLNVAYNGKDVKDLLEYLFELEKENERLNKTIDKSIEYIDNNYPVCAGSELLDILKGSDKE